MIEAGDGRPQAWCWRRRAPEARTPRWRKQLIPSWSFLSLSLQGGTVPRIQHLYLYLYLYCTCCTVLPERIERNLGSADCVAHTRPDGTRQRRLTSPQSPHPLQNVHDRRDRRERDDAPHEDLLVEAVVDADADGDAERRAGQPDEVVVEVVRQEDVLSDELADGEQLREEEEDCAGRARRLGWAHGADGREV